MNQTKPLPNHQKVTASALPDLNKKARDLRQRILNDDITAEERNVLVDCLVETERAIADITSKGVGQTTTEEIEIPPLPDEKSPADEIWEQALTEIRHIRKGGAAGVPAINEDKRQRDERQEEGDEGT